MGLFRPKKGKRGNQVKDDVPPHIRLLCEALEKKGLEAEGIFRISGKKAESDKLKEVLANKKADLSKIDPWEYCKSPHSIAALIRLYFREMKEPILTFELYDSFIAAESQKGAERITTIGKLIEALPPKNKQLLSYFTTFLNNVSKHSSTNKMVASNLSTIFAPSFMQPEAQSAEQLLNDMPITASIVTTLIEKNDVFFPKKRPMLAEVNDLSTAFLSITAKPDAGKADAGKADAKTEAKPDEAKPDVKPEVKPDVKQVMSVEKKILEVKHDDAKPAAASEKPPATPITPATPEKPVTSPVPDRLQESNERPTSSKPESSDDEAPPSPSPLFQKLLHLAQISLETLTLINGTFEYLFHNRCELSHSLDEIVLTEKLAETVILMLNGASIRLDFPGYQNNVEVKGTPQELAAARERATAKKSQFLKQIKDLAQSIHSATSGEMDEDEARVIILEIAGKLKGPRQLVAVYDPRTVKENRALNADERKEVDDMKKRVDSLFVLVDQKTAECKTGKSYVCLIKILRSVQALLKQSLDVHLTAMPDIEIPQPEEVPQDDATIAKLSTLGEVIHTMTVDSRQRVAALFADFHKDKADTSVHRRFKELLMLLDLVDKIPRPIKLNAPQNEDSLQQLRQAGLNTIKTLKSKLAKYEDVLKNTQNIHTIMQLAEMFRNVKTALTTNPNTLNIEEMLRNRKSVNAVIMPGLAYNSPAVVGVRDRGLQAHIEGSELLGELLSQVPKIGKQEHLNLYIQMLRHIIQILKAQDALAAPV